MEVSNYYTKTKLKERIKTVRKHYKLNQIEFGKKLGVSRDVISNIEQGRVEAKDLIINHICDIYAINKNWLLYGKGNMLKEDEMEKYILISKIIVFNELEVDW